MATDDSRSDSNARPDSDGIQLGGDGIATLTVPVSVAASGHAGAVLSAAVARLTSEPSLRGVILRPVAAPSTPDPDGPHDHDGRSGRALGDALQALERLPVPLVAVLAEPVRGDALAVVLACHHRIALVRDDMRVGLPAAAAAFPAAGASVRLVRLLGLETAFPLLHEGFEAGAARALELGLVDALAADMTRLQKAARAWIAAHPQTTSQTTLSSQTPLSSQTTPRWSPRPLLISGNPPGVAATPPALLAWVQHAPARLAAAYRGEVPAAARALLAAVVESLQVDFATALRIEARYALALRNARSVIRA